MDSTVLGVSLRWEEDQIRCWNEAQDTWISVQDIPVSQGMQQGLQEGLHEGELKTWGRLLHRLLDAEAPGAADIVIGVWSTSPPPEWPSDEILDRLEASPHEWRQLLLEP